MSTLMCVHCFVIGLMHVHCCVYIVIPQFGLDVDRTMMLKVGKLFV